MLKWIKLKKKGNNGNILVCKPISVEMLTLFSLACLVPWRAPVLHLTVHSSLSTFGFTSLPVQTNLISRQFRPTLVFSCRTIWPPFIDTTGLGFGQVMLFSSIHLNASDLVMFNLLLASVMLNTLWIWLAPPDVRAEGAPSMLIWIHCFCFYVEFKVIKMFHPTCTCPTLTA